MNLTFRVIIIKHIESKLNKQSCLGRTAQQKPLCQDLTRVRRLAWMG